MHHALKVHLMNAEYHSAPELQPLRPRDGRIIVCQHEPFEASLRQFEHVVRHLKRYENAIKRQVERLVASRVQIDNTGGSAERLQHLALLTEVDTMLSGS